MAQGFLRLMATAMVSLLPFSEAYGQDLKQLTISDLGRPPILAATFADLGQDLGIWTAVGLDAKFRWFQQGTDTAKAVLTGDVAVGFTGTQAALNLIAAGAPIVAIAGQPNQDFFIASDDPGIHGCADLKGKTVVTDGIGNARYLYLQSTLATCGLKIADISSLTLNSSTQVKSAIAGQIQTGVFHIDEIAQVEFAGRKKFTRFPTPESLESTSHYTFLIVAKSRIVEDRESLVRFLEGWILTQNMMSSKEAGPRLVVAMSVSRATGSDLQVAYNAIGDYQAIKYWVNNDGLDEQHVMGQLDRLIAAGSVKAASKPSYDAIVDKTLYDEAMKRVRAKYGPVGE